MTQTHSPRQQEGAASECLPLNGRREELGGKQARLALHLVSSVLLLLRAQRLEGTAPRSDPIPSCQGLAQFGFWLGCYQEKKPLHFGGAACSAGLRAGKGHSHPMCWGGASLYPPPFALSAAWCGRHPLEEVIEACCGGRDLRDHLVQLLLGTETTTAFLTEDCSASPRRSPAWCGSLSPG